jgi:AcrR family transcriptional regulator
MTQQTASGKRGRTRKAILAATVALLAEGKSPTVADVAEAAEVSRRTVYLYFPTLEQLLIDATLQAVASTTVDDALAAASPDDDVEARVERMARAVQRLSAATEQEGRTLMRLTADPGADGAARSQPPRGFRRVEWIERALEPLRSTVDAERYERLVSSLAMVLGWEALIVQRDIRALSVSDAEDVSAWAARALVRATLLELADLDVAQ